MPVPEALSAAQVANVPFNHAKHGQERFHLSEGG